MLTFGAARYPMKAPLYSISICKSPRGIMETIEGFVTRTDITTTISVGVDSLKSNTTIVTSGKLLNAIITYYVRTNMIMDVIITGGLNKQSTYR
jgi:2-keto-3-deoxy-6-phosphogluconate aldolase